MKNIILITYLAFIILGATQAQHPFACEKAIRVCELDTVFLHSHNQSTEINDIITHRCGVDIAVEDLYTGINWLRYEFASSGEFLFTIYPIGMNTDLDFMVFNSAGDCNSLSNVRCMFSGSYGEDRCMGTTGLSKNSFDIIEYAGCNYDDDNYLAPINVSKGTVLYIAIINADNDGSDYHIVSRGTATVVCNEQIAVSEQSPTKENTVIDESPTVIYTKVYPNPTAGLLYIAGYLPDNEEVALEVYNDDGKNYIRQSVSLNSVLDISHLSSGIYFIKLYNDGQLIHNQSIINIK